MIDINQLRLSKGGHPDAIFEAEKKRGRDGEIVRTVVALDEEWIRLQYQIDNLRKEANAAAKAVGVLKQAGKNVDEAVAEAAKIKAMIPEATSKCDDILEQRDKLLRKIGNPIDPAVPISNTEDDNAVLRTWGTPKVPSATGGPGAYPHYELIEKIHGIEMKKAASIAGHRAYYLKGYGAMFNQALIMYGQKFLRDRQYLNVQTPNFIRENYMAKSAELSDFNETLYKIDMDKDEPMFLIATSEQPLCCLHADSTMSPAELPIRYAGMSTCYRREAGSHGKDVKGLFRVHQFEKVEQFVICEPTDSKKLHEEMVAISEEFLRTLELPYRTIAIVSGALNDAAAMKYDIEAWFPSQESYRELVSCSNCTDYQARSLNIRLGVSKMGDREKSFVHMLNGTLCATQRTLCCILENWQDETGIIIPPVLRPYMDNLEHIPFSS